MPNKPEMLYLAFSFARVLICNDHLLTWEDLADEQPYLVTWYVVHMFATRLFKFLYAKWCESQDWFYQVDNTLLKLKKCEGYNSSATTKLQHKIKSQKEEIRELQYEVSRLVEFTRINEEREEKAVTKDILEGF